MSEERVFLSKNSVANESLLRKTKQKGVLQ